MPEQVLSPPAGSRRSLVNAGPALAAGCVVFAIAVYGCFLRFRGLGGQSLWMDEAFSVAHALAILKHAYPLLENGVVSWSYAIPHYLMALGVALSGDIHFGARFFPALAGSLLAPVFYYFNKEFSGSRLQAVIACFFQTLMAYQVAWSRQARGYVLLQLFIVLSMLFWLRFLKRRKIVSLVPALVFAGLGAFTHRAGYMAFAYIFLSLPSMALKGEISWRACLKKHRGMLMLGVLLTMPTALALLLVESNVSVGELLGGLAERAGMNYSGMYASFLFFGLFRVLSLWMVVGVCAACFRNPGMCLPLAALVAIYFIVISFFTTLFHLRYLLPVIPFLISFAAYGFCSALDFASKRSRPGIKAAVAAVLWVCFALSVPFAEMAFVPRSYYFLGYTAPQPDWREAFKWIENDHATSDGESELRVTTTLPVMADLYLPGGGVNKYFLPFSFSGRPGDFQSEAPYSSAVTITDPGEIRGIGGYIVLDTFGLARMRDGKLSEYLRSLRPTRVVHGNAPGMFPVFVWKVQSR